MTGSPKAPRPPSPTREERGLQREQANTLRLQRDILRGQQQVANEFLDVERRRQRQVQELQPILLQRAGLERGPGGRLREIPSEAAEARERVELGLLERTEQALAGELPVSPQLQRSLDERRAALNESLVRDFGSLEAARLSSAGQERLSRFGEFEEGTLESARRGDIGTATQLALGVGGFGQQAGQQGLQNVQAVGSDPFGISSGLGTASNIFGQTAQGVGQAASGLSAPIGQLARQRELQFQAALQAAQRPTTGQQLLGTFGQVSGTALGIGLAGGFGVFGGGE